MKLHLQVKKQAEIIDHYECLANDIRRYINLPKYRNNPLDGVNPADILLRLNEWQSEIDRIG